ncbi:hypothetical protein PENTCL1PPCAC_5987, partial [Pristionchus entomophagus]
RSLACYGKYALELYMKPADVQASLHVRDIIAESINWDVVNRKIAQDFRRDRNVLPVYDDIFTLVNGSSFRILIYNGDTDTIKAPLHTILGTSKIATSNDLKEKVNNLGWRFFGDFGGIHTGYSRGNTTMDLITVRGAGHSVPTNLPAQAFQIINNFISQKNHEINYSE